MEGVATNLPPLKRWGQRAWPPPPRWPCSLPPVCHPTACEGVLVSKHQLLEFQLLMRNILSSWKIFYLAVQNIFSTCAKYFCFLLSIVFEVLTGGTTLLRLPPQCDCDRNGLWFIQLLLIYKMSLLLPIIYQWDHWSWKWGVGFFVTVITGSNFSCLRWRSPGGLLLLLRLILLLLLQGDQQQLLFFKSFSRAVKN